MNRRSSALVLTLMPILVLVRAPATLAASPDPWSWPLDDHALGERFDPPQSDYGAGHRGVDISARAGDVVRAVAAGIVTFAGQVGGVPVVTIDHGRERSTYQPVRSHMHVGDAVQSGQAVGTLLGSPSHCAGACLHLGRLAGDDYLDPLALLGGGAVRLIDPHGKPPAPPAGVGEARLQRPVGGPVTSSFGMRVHPVTGVRKLHDGTDFGVPCGTPVHSAGAGTVVGRSFSAAYGKRVTIRHRPGLETSYNHLSDQSVSVGERVGARDVVGRSGTTGLSTGCHLHFMVLKAGRAVNPQDLL
ncbi:peptidoglycan DD-metalloendopeptidase family protein [Aeromicrobium sp.]|uniref:peptidoglycan DD-metalloendopeptidase family protein n=1 Tax=Aeromicrobium sp. TaxID=1871063 RepID=UPI0019A273E2|nr:peptidoglycan DD-metalloendopeptidase family protein [Aeromicrobium sp.]MBC7633099.1 peptidoglycan DD-metalloendopeptidase family protein [Aeromicrobium sp.]